MGIIIWILVFALLCAAARGLYLRERRAAMRMQMAMIREGMDAVKAEQAEAGEMLKSLRENRPPEAAAPAYKTGGVSNV